MFAVRLQQECVTAFPKSGLYEDVRKFRLERWMEMKLGLLNSMDVVLRGMCRYQHRYHLGNSHPKIARRNPRPGALIFEKDVAKVICAPAKASKRITEN